MSNQRASAGPETTYSINEVAGLTGLHRNTIRNKVRLGQLRSSIHHGKFGEEYRISRQALIDAGLIESEGPLGDQGGTPVFEAVLEQDEHRAEVGGESALARPTAIEALHELYQRHEQAMFRLGYIQAELDRVRALADTAESLREADREREEEMARLRDELAAAKEHESMAGRLRAELDAVKDRAEAAERLQAELEAARRREAELREAQAELDAARQREASAAAEAARRRDELEAQTREQASRIELLEEAARRPWWRFW